MKTILVPIDGSENSKRAMLKAKELADCLGSKIIIMNVMNIVTTVSIYPNLQSAKTGGSVDWPGIYDAAKERSEKLLGEAKELLKGSDVETVMIDDPSGKFATAIVTLPMSGMWIHSHGVQRDGFPEASAVSRERYN